jgi:hypothetical protein
MTRIVSLAYFLVAVAGCGGGTPMSMPDMKMAPMPPALYIGDTAPGTPADESCVGHFMDPAAPTTDTVVMGTIKDFQDMNLVMGAVVSVYLTPADVMSKTAIAMSTPSDANGKYMLTVPKGHFRVIMGNTGGKAISNGNPVDTIDTYEFNVRYDYATATAVKTSTRDAIPGLVSVDPDPALGVLAGTVRDCNGKEMGGAIVDVSNTSAMYDSSQFIFYFQSVSGTTLPTRTLKWTSGSVGVFAALNVPTGTATLNANGIIGSGSLMKLGSETVPVLPGSITIADILPASM